jgi:hypothetical protein
MIETGNDAYLTLLTILVERGGHPVIARFMTRLGGASVTSRGTLGRNIDQSEIPDPLKARRGRELLSDTLTIVIEHDGQPSGGFVVRREAIFTVSDAQFDSPGLYGQVAETTIAIRDDDRAPASGVLMLYWQPPADHRRIHVG